MWTVPKVISMNCDCWEVNCFFPSQLLIHVNSSMDYDFWEVNSSFPFSFLIYTIITKRDLKCKLILIFWGYTSYHRRIWSPSLPLGTWHWHLNPFGFKTKIQQSSDRRAPVKQREDFKSRHLTFITHTTY